MKRILATVVVILVFTIKLFCQYPLVVIETNHGEMFIELYEETPLHSENFIKLVKEGFYNGLLFHRVMNNFMIQTGDPDSRNAQPGVRLGSGGPGYTIPAEFVPEYYHKKGAIAAARQGDNINPKKESSGSQFYIVQGNVFNLQQLNTMGMQGIHPKFTQQQVKDYTTIGGTPHLDYNYTVFGELIMGQEVLDKIASLPTDKFNRPVEDVTIIKMYIEKN